MSSFTDTLDFDCIGVGKYKTRRHFRFYLKDSLTGDYVEVPACFVSNGASIPRPLQIIFGWYPLDIRWSQASFLHDAMVGETGVKMCICNDQTGRARYASWSESADWFDKALKIKRANSQGCPYLNRKLLVLGVRMWGLVRGL